MEWGGAACPRAKHFRDTGRQKSTVKHSQPSVFYLKKLENQQLRVPGTEQPMVFCNPAGHAARDRRMCGPRTHCTTMAEAGGPSVAKVITHMCPFPCSAPAPPLLNPLPDTGWSLPLSCTLTDWCLLTAPCDRSPVGGMELDLGQLHPGLTSCSIPMPELVSPCAAAEPLTTHSV